MSKIRYTCHYVIEDFFVDNVLCIFVTSFLEIFYQNFKPLGKVTPDAAPYNCAEVTLDAIAYNCPWLKTGLGKHIPTVLGICP